MTPTAIEKVTVSAPAKVIVFGEHAVVYDCPAIVAALTDLRLNATIDRVPNSDGIECFYTDLISPRDGMALQRVFSIEALHNVVKDFQDDRWYLPKPSPEVIARLEALLALEDQEDIKPLMPSLFLCCALLRSSPILNGKQGGLKIKIWAKDFPVGAGLGSSAALCVALSGAFARLSNHPRHLDVEFINSYAYAAEVIVHGSPSGADNTISAFGGTIVFQKSSVPVFRNIQCDLNEFKFLLVNTRVPRSTKVQVTNVRKLYDANQSIIQKKFDEIEAISLNFITLAEQKKLDEETLGRQLERNHALLNELGVGHPLIEQVVETCKRYGCATKLTGAGGGGCTLSLLPRAMDDVTLQKLVAELEGKNFQCFVSSVGGAGFIDESSTSNQN